MTEKENQCCFDCEHCFIAHDYALTCELTHKTVDWDDGAVCENFKEEEEDEVSNELEALEKITNYKCSSMSEKIKCKEIIKTALKDYEDLQKVLDDFGIHNIQNLIDTLKNIDFLETELLGQSQELNIKNKALEIIKEKRVNLDLFYYSKNLEDYNRNIATNNRLLTQEEYDLLKEVLL